MQHKVYVDGVLRDLQDIAEQGKSLSFDTLYIGGGTPSVLGYELIRLLKGIFAIFPTVKFREITVEVNPESASQEIIEALVSTGVTRISVGVQSLVDGELEALGRLHNAEEALSVCRLIKATSADLCVDLMCGIPLQTYPLWYYSLQQIIFLKPDHVSIYPLSIEEGTVLEQQIELGAIVLPGEELVADMMQTGCDLLDYFAYEHYEIANYAKPGHRSLHNSSYWTGKPYLGLGAGAASMFTELDGSRLRIDGKGLVEKLTKQQALREDLMLGMRMRDGVSDTQVANARCKTVFKKLESQNLVQLDEETQRWRATDKGWMLGNDIFSAIWCRD